MVAGLTLGTGVGGGLVIDGEVFSGARGLAGEFGHISLADEPECTCGSSGCLGRLAGGTATGARYERLSGREPVRTDEIIRRANDGDAAAQEALDVTVGYLVRGVRTIVNLLNPDVFVLCGGLSTGWGDPLAEAIQEGLKDTTFPGLDETPIRISKLGNVRGRHRRRAPRPGLTASPTRQVTAISAVCRQKSQAPRLNGQAGCLGRGEVAGFDCCRHCAAGLGLVAAVAELADARPASRSPRRGGPRSRPRRPVRAGRACRSSGRRRAA